MRKIILASASPRRKALLEQIGLQFAVEGSNIEEKLNPRLRPRGNAEQLSLQKAKAVAEKYSPHSLLLLKGEELNMQISPTSRERRRKYGKKKNEGVIIIAADTFIVFKEEILGKPANKEEARKMLKKLSGDHHSVITGFTILDTVSGRTITKSVETKVKFRKISLREIEAYLRTREPLGKAGAYAIQEKGAIFVESIEGEPFNVAGLPIQAVNEELKHFGVKV